MNFGWCSTEPGAGPFQLWIFYNSMILTSCAHHLCTTHISCSFSWYNYQIILERFLLFLELQEIQDFQRHLGDSWVHPHWNYSGLARCYLKLPVLYARVFLLVVFFFPLIAHNSILHCTHHPKLSSSCTAWKPLDTITVFSCII